MFHVLILVATILGQPVGIAKDPGDVAYADKAACDAKVAETIASAQSIIDGNEKTKGQFVIVNGKCFSDSEIEQLQHYKERSALDKNIGEERVD